MAHLLFSPSWYRVSKLRPRIRGHNQIHRHTSGDEIRYLLQNHSTGQVYRFTPMVYRVIGMMDGERTVQHLWQQTTEHFGDNGPTQHDILQLLSQLYSADMLVCDVTPDIDNLLGRSRASEKAPHNRMLKGNILFFRLGLIDPEKFLSLTSPLTTLFFSLPFILLSLLVMLGAMTQVFFNWNELTTNMADRVLTLDNIFLLFITYPLIKVLHEMAHGYAVKHWGGEVHEMGIMMLVFMPLPYVDATSAATFRNKWQRVAVSMAGMYMEMLLAAIAVFFWVALEPGLARAVAYNVILIGGVSTLFFNGNPLIKFDGYYILSDLLNIPNLAQRSLQYLGFLFNTYILRIPNLRPVILTQHERFWLTFYGIASSVYRLILSVTIILFVMGKYLVIGILLAFFGFYSMLLLPLVRKVRHLLTDTVYHEKRHRSLMIVSSLLLMILFLLTLLPLPYLNVTEGVLWLPEESYLRIKSDGIVKRVVLPSNSSVVQGDILIECYDPLLETKVRILSSQLREYTFRHHAISLTDPVEAKIISEQIQDLKQQISSYSEQLDNMTVHSPTDGLFILPTSNDIPGRFLRQGDLVGYILRKSNTVRIAVPERQVDLIRKNSNNVELRSISKATEIYRGKIIRELPGATNILPSKILGAEGGGSFSIDPLDTTGSRTLHKMFQFDIRLEAPLTTTAVGKRILVRFDHGYEPIFFRLYRAAKQLFLKKLNV